MIAQGWAQVSGKRVFRRANLRCKLDISKRALPVRVADEWGINRGQRGQDRWRVGPQSPPSYNGSHIFALADDLAARLDEALLFPRRQDAFEFLALKMRGMHSHCHTADACDFALRGERLQLGS